MHIKVKDIINYKNALDKTDGIKLFKVVSDNILIEERIILDFEDIKYYSSSFFNWSIGQLFRDFSVNLINAKIKIINITKLGKTFLNLILVNAEEYYKLNDPIDISISTYSWEEK